MSAAPTTTRRPSLIALILLTGVSPLATDMYLPALPAMTHELHSTDAVMGLTLTAFLVGLALGQVVLGPVSDALGRRRFVVGGPLVFLLLSVGCALAPNGTVLVALRFLQGIAGAAGMVCGRAAITDYFHGVRADRQQSAVLAAGLLGPVVAPGIGGLLLSVGDWRLVFGVLSGVGALMLVAAVVGVPETLPPQERHPVGLRATAARMGSLLTDRRFRVQVVVGSLATCGFFSYIGGSPFVLQQHYGIGESVYSLVFATNASGMMLVSVANTGLIMRVGAHRLRTIGLTVATACAAALLATGLFGIDTLGSTWALLAGVTAAMGLVLPSGLALGQRAGRRYAGTASALQGGIQFGLGALMTPMVGLLGAATVVPMAVLMAGFMAAALAVAVLRADPARLGRWAGTDRAQASNL